MHLKRNKVGKFWPIPRKGTKYIAVASHNYKDSMPLVIVLRDLFKIVRNKKELQKAINEKQILINNKEVRDVKYPVCLFDIITLKNSNKSYRAGLSVNKKMVFEEVSGKESETKVFKIIDKKSLSKNRTQLNLMHGRNIITKEKAETGDSILFNLKENKIVKVIPMEKGKNAYVTKGKHAGNKGKIDEIIDRGGKKLAKINTGEEKINVWTKNVVATE